MKYLIALTDKQLDALMHAASNGYVSAPSPSALANAHAALCKAMREKNELPSRAAILCSGMKQAHKDALLRAGR